MKEKTIIVLVGLSLAGKDTVANYFVRQDFFHLSLSDILRDICRKRYVYRNREDLIKYGNLLRRKYGTGYLASQAVKKASQHKKNNIVISSVRNPGEVKEFKKHGCVVILEVKASIKIRWQRAKRRNKIDDKVNFKKFENQETRERKGAAHQQQLDKVISMADFSVNNDRTKNYLYMQIKKVLAEIIADGIFNIVVLGPQGSGKGTQAAGLAEQFKLAHIETGKVFRKISRQPTTLGRKIGFIMNQKGRLLPTSFVNKILKGELGKVNWNKGIVFDGYPRNLIQARTLDKILKLLNRQLTHAFYLPISRQSTIKRLILRRICRKCGRIFIKGVDLKASARHCPVCHGVIYQRDDDKPVAIARRLNIYHQQTKPVINYYKKKGILIKVDGEPPIKQVFKAIMKYFH